jgi:hypothetical protein
VSCASSPNSRATLTPATDHLDFALRSETIGADGRAVVKVDVTKVERQHAPASHSSRRLSDQR